MTTYCFGKQNVVEPDGPIPREILRDLRIQNIVIAIDDQTLAREAGIFSIYDVFEMAKQENRDYSVTMNLKDKVNLIEEIIDDETVVIHEDIGIGADEFLETHVDAPIYGSSNPTSS